MSTVPVRERAAGLLRRVAGRLHDADDQPDGSAASNVVTEAEVIAAAEAAGHYFRVPAPADWHDLLPFTTHRIRLAADRYTASEGVEPERDLRTELAVESVGGIEGLAGASVVDLGCLEGGFALEFARRGAQRVLGIEAREASVARCELARDLMGLLRAEFLCADITEALAEQEPFDIVFAAGVLYHLEDPAAMLATMGSRCRRFAVVDTHVASGVVTHGCSDEVTVPGPDGGYRGRWFDEYDPASTDEERAGMLWAAAKTPKAFWPFEEDLVRMITDAGFSSAEKIDAEAYEPDWQVDPTNRVLYICTV